ncbi:MAG: hypothetical protein ABIQ88_07220 [Chitinophagaceae bacterium]
MNHTIFLITLVLHITSGSVGLLSGTIGMVSKKAGKLHKRVGKTFFYAMAGVFVTSLYMSIVKDNVFLLLIGFFSFYLASTGYRILYLKKLGVQKIRPKAIDYLIGYTGMVSGIVMLAYAAFLFMRHNQFGIVIFVFGCLAFWLGYRDMRKFKVLPTEKTHWIVGHGMRMAGAYAATVTAFVVVNIQIQQQWILWLLPAAIVIPLAQRYVNRFIKPAKKVLQRQSDSNMAV